MSLLQDIEIDIRRVGRSDWPAGVQFYSPWILPQTLPHFELWFIWRGRGWVIVGDQRIALRQGELYLFRPDIVYQVEQDPHAPWGNNYVKFDLSKNGNPLKTVPNDWPTLIEEVEADLTESITRRIVELYWQCYVDYKGSPEASRLSTIPYFKFADDHYEHFLFAPLPISIYSPPEKSGQGSILAADALFRGLLIEILHQSKRQQKQSLNSLDKYQRRTISRIAMRIQQDPSAKFSTTTLAEECGYSGDYFTRLFKSVMNCTPQQYQVSARVNKACLLLRESDLLIKQIAAQLGYCNEYFFSRQFKATIGESPRDYRKREQATQ